jgi:hypothetical protein
MEVIRIILGYPTSSNNLNYDWEFNYDWDFDWCSFPNAEAVGIRVSDGYGYLVNDGKGIEVFVDAIKRDLGYGENPSLIVYKEDDPYLSSKFEGEAYSNFRDLAQKINRGELTYVDPPTVEQVLGTIEPIASTLGLGIVLK